MRHYTSDGNLSGTPTQPGVWEVVIRQPEFICPEGITPPQDVRVRFNIEGIAPKRVR